MANASTAGATAPKTPPHSVPVNSGSELKSTPLAVGSASVSEYISTVGVNVNDIRPWIGCDVENYRECPVDEMLQELLYCCANHSESKLVPDKPTLLADCLEAVLPICNKGKDAKAIKKNLDDILKSKVEDQMYKPFIQASNLALNWLSKLNVPGLAWTGSCHIYALLALIVGHL
ncbi:hypothetical protein DFJ58DRAFT_819001 [Suillus subalutaceus]|uniref:uncharacterized protein n=1 Tax=Suillus subalutaceus TaxID=48586 RepID=UPI001B87ED77|nr:uncharacterized protein DFJ58DRAFT_819001 [Suillus subalutaceus]KAG1836235.1 hypothetical protein DFJ58DRAFT_819001 [Suillus subalutaceus]